MFITVGIFPFSVVGAILWEILNGKVERCPVVSGVIESEVVQQHAEQMAGALRKVAGLGVDKKCGFLRGFCLQVLPDTSLL